MRIDPVSSGNVVVSNDELVEQIWREFDGRVPRTRILEVSMNIAAGFRDATITTFVSLIVRRKTREALAREA